MVSGQANAVLRAIRKLAETEATRKLPDAELLRRFFNERDEASFKAIVRRHGPMVFRVCLRVLRDEQDAEDGFQATFLVLTKKAGSVQWRESVGSWLFGVAYRVSCDMKKKAVRRRTRERQMEDKPPADPLAEISVREAQEGLDQELALLPEKYRAPLLLCCLEGLARDEAAQQLGISVGTVKSRLEQARELLRNRLARRGVTLSGALLASTLYGQSASAALRSVLVDSTVKAATTVAAGGATTTVVSANVAALAEGVINHMLLTKSKNVLIALAVAAVTCCACVMLVAANTAAEPRGEEPRKTATPQAQKDKPPENLERYLESQSWALTEVDPENNTVSARLFRFAEMDSLISGFGIETPGMITSGQFNLKEVPVKKDAKIVIDGKAAAFKDLKRRMRVSLRLAPNDGQVTGIEATSPTLYVLKATDVARNTITVATGDSELVLTPAVNARYMIQRGGEEGITRKQVEEGLYRGQFTDLKPGMRVDLQLGYQDGKILVTFIKAEK